MIEKKNKYKIGVLGCFYNCHENLDKVLNPWFNSIHNKDFTFSCISSPFIEYSEIGIKENNLETKSILRFLLENKLINYLNISDISLTETNARDIALKPLIDSGCNYILLLDGDEIYSEKDIHNILYFLNQEENQLYNHFKIEFKNLVFDYNHYIKGFSPKRIWKVLDNDNKKLFKVRYDNDMSYLDLNGNEIIDDNLSCKKINTELVNPLHYSWCDFERSKKKIKYQEKRWSPPNGNGCSFKVDEENKKIVWNKEYFDRTGQQIPEIYI